VSRFRLMAVEKASHKIGRRGDPCCALAPGPSPPQRSSSETLTLRSMIADSGSSYDPCPVRGPHSTRDGLYLRLWKVGSLSCGRPHSQAPFQQVSEFREHPTTDDRPTVRPIWCLEDSVTTPQSQRLPLPEDRLADEELAHQAELLIADFDTVPLGRTLVRRSPFGRPAKGGFMP
jgi:hypothetical protein